MTAKDAMWIDEQKLGRTEIAAIFRVPPHKIGDLERSTFSNIEQQSQDYVEDALHPRAQLWEERLALDLLSEAEQDEYFFEYLFEALLRGDTTQRFSAYHNALTDGWMTRNEVRIRENLNPAAGLDEFLQQANMAPVSGSPSTGAAA
jgi:HK97 family phage portal protein